MECFVCKNSFPSKYDLMEHKKKNYPSKIPCNKFQKGECHRSAEECRYKHVGITLQPSNTISQPTNSEQPLPSMWQKDFPPLVPSAAPDQEALILALNMVHQRLQAMEKMFPRLI